MTQRDGEKKNMDGRASPSLSYFQSSIDNTQKRKYSQQPTNQQVSKYQTSTDGGMEEPELLGNIENCLDGFQGQEIVLDDQGIKPNDTSVISEEKSIELKPEVPAQAEMIRLRRTSGLDLQFKSAESKPTVSSEASAPINNAYAFSMGRGTKNGKNSQESQKQKKSS